jgi:hypothetical protein
MKQYNCFYDVAFETNAMAAKCDTRLNWWISLGNLYLQEVPTVKDSTVGNPGFAQRVRRLAGPRPRSVNLLLNRRDPLSDRLIALGDDPDRCLWGVAGVAVSVLSELSELQRKKSMSREITIADWSRFTAPLILSVASTGEITEAHRPEPLATDLLPLLLRRNVRTLGVCPVCGKLFERLRRDQQCDTRACRDVYRQRRFRANRQHDEMKSD